jgi:co-chaperonin GroES (HSP10)|tara:strand:+ start:189 stop:608 length:420 start_codon:yes stop_codon:yes gene_type:complete
MQTVAMEKAIKNDMWVSNEEIPLPKVLPELPGFNILVRPVSIKSQTKGGIFIPDSTKDDMAYLTTVGEVVVLGDVAYQDKEKFPKGPWCKVGDYICYGKHSGQKIQYKGLKFILLYDDQVIMKVENPKTLDPTFNLSKH